MTTAHAALLLAATAAAASSYRAEVGRWREQREVRLRAPDGWLSVAGLFWLKEGSNTLGTAAGSHVKLPAGSAPARAGTVELTGGKATLRLEPTVNATVNGKPVSVAVELRADTATGGPDVLALGRLQMSVIERSGRHGLRVRDPQNPPRTGFHGLRWFPVKEEYRVTARFVPTAGKTIPIVNVLGQLSDMRSPGQVVFTLGGREYRLDPVLEEGEEELWFLFRDQTAGKESYPAGRYLYAPAPKDGQTVLDFNKAYSPPCAYTRFATCPLPPKQNRLAVRIEAGEKDPKLVH